MEPLDMETAALVAPVTALEFLQDAFLLTGGHKHINMLGEVSFFPLHVAHVITYM